MRDVEIPVPQDVDSSLVTDAIEHALAELGLTVTLRGSLKKFPNCIHWHAKNGQQSGTLEITYWPQERRAWFTVQNGRTADWIDAKIDFLQKLLQNTWT